MWIVGHNKVKIRFIVYLDTVFHGCFHQVNGRWQTDTSKEWNLLKELCCRGFFKCFPHFYGMQALFLSFLLILLWVICMGTEDIEGKIPFPYGGRDTEVLYVGSGIRRSGLHCLHGQSCNTDTNSWMCHGTSNGTRYYLPLFEGPF